MARLRFPLLILLCVTVAVVATTVGIAVCVGRSNAIFPGVTIAQNPVGGLTRAEAEARVSEWASELMTRELVLTDGETRWMAKFGDIGVHAKIQPAVDRAYAVGREEGLLRRVVASIGLGAPDIHVDIMADPGLLDPVMKKIADAVNVQEQDASIRIIDGRYEIEPEVIGAKLDKDATKSVVLAVVESGVSLVDIIVLPDEPQIRAAHLESIDTMITSYTTNFAVWRTDRTHNIRLSSKAIDGTVVMPGEVFSFNDVVGPREKSRGYRDAQIYRNGMLVLGTGGGICQVSSTLYNAVLLSNMEIVQRSNHSSEVPYVARGRDATVAYGLLDLKFRNVATSPIYMKTGIQGGRLTVAFHGSKQDKMDVALEVVGGARNQSGKSTVSVYRLVKKDGELVTRSLVSRDTYRPLKLAETTAGSRRVGPTTPTSTAAVDPGGPG